MAQKRNYASKQRGKTEVEPFWNIEDIKNVIEWFENTRVIREKQGRKIMKIGQFK